MRERGGDRPAPDGPPPKDLAPGVSTRARSSGRALTGLPLALQFLTVIPIQTPQRASSSEDSDQAPRMARALPWFPLVGALVGCLIALLDWAVRPALSLGVRSVLVLALTAGLTGMLHLDGFIDCCDGLLGARSTARRLDILRDSRVGAYGVIGGCLLLLLRYAALVALTRPDLRMLALIVAPLLGRWSLVYAVVRYPYARSTGAGSPFRGGSGRHLARATLSALVLLVLISAALAIAFGTPSLPRALARDGFLVCGALLTTIVATTWMSKRLDGGLTGDTYGALNECVEAVTLVLLPVFVAIVAHLPLG